MQDVTFSAAQPDEDQEIQRILRDNPMSGFLTLSFERAPSFLRTSAIEGDNVITTLCRTKGELVGLGTRSSRLCWVNHRIERIGYLNHLRVDKKFRGQPFYVLKAHERLWEVNHQINDTVLYYTAVVADNTVARRFLTSRNKRLPVYDEIDTFVTFIIPRKKYLKPKRVVRLAQENDEPILLELLGEYNQRYQLSPVWQAGTLFQPEFNLKPSNFLIAYEESTPVGCLGIWDQRSFKQIRIRDYHWSIKALRPLLNVFGGYWGLPRFPQVGDFFDHIFLSHIALKDPSSDTITDLIQTALSLDERSKISYFALGLSVSNPTYSTVEKSLRVMKYKSKICLVYWPDGREKRETFLPGPTHLELALL